MPMVYTKKQAATQKSTASTASSFLDASSQSKSLQRKADMANDAAQRAEAPRPNNTGMPDNLKAGIESLSGFSMDDVRVHYNSSKPATVQALAYTQGTDIHVAPGQEKCLPHEAWHVAQQMAGRVSPTTNINGMPVNDNAALEHEADVMGEKAVQCKFDFINRSKPNLIKCLQRIVNVGGEYADRIEAIRATSEVVAADAENVEKTRNLYLKGSDNKRPLTKNDLIKDEIYNSVYGNQCNLSLKYHFDYRIRLKGNDDKDKDRIKKILNVNDDVATTALQKVKIINGDDEKIADAHGYVVYISDSGRNLSAYMKGFGVNGVTTKYDSKHDVICKNNLCKLINASDDIPKSADAYTKLAGEGARFQCVRNNMSRLTNDTLFYCRAPKGFVACSFKDLWNSWDEVFCKKYNISDDKVANEMRNGGLKGKDVYPSSDDDVNLDLNSDCEKFEFIEKIKDELTPYVYFYVALIDENNEKVCRRIPYCCLGNLFENSEGRLSNEFVSRQMLKSKMTEKKKGDYEIGYFLKKNEKIEFYDSSSQPPQLQPQSPQPQQGPTPTPEA